MEAEVTWISRFFDRFLLRCCFLVFGRVVFPPDFRQIEQSA